MKRQLSKLALLFVALIVGKADSYAEPERGPAEYGLRLRLEVKPLAEPKQDGYEVRVDLLNISPRDVTLRAKWRYDDEGDLKDYIEAATSIECFPPVAPWIGGVAVGKRQSTQPEYVLKPGEVLTARWKTNGRFLKNRVTNPNDVQNPKFPFPGLYSVHATLDVITSDRTVHLRSNEQLVSVGGSQEMPKYTFGRLLHASPENKTAILGLGSLHKIEPGDRFEIGHAKGEHWRLTITQVEPGLSTGEVEVLTRTNYPNRSAVPTAQMEATLIQK